MIIYQNQKPIGCTETDCVGVVGDNIAYTQDFYIKGVSDESISYTLHLRFADGSVNSIAVKNVLLDNNGTMLRWVVKKGDIFTHGYFELQIEGRNHLGLVYQTEIVRLFAHESLPVEDREYENPNSETLRLREEAYAALEEMKIQQANIEANAKIIEQSGLSNKADKSTTLSGYGITDAYTKSEVDSKINDIPGGNIDGVEKTANKVGSSTDITDESVNYPSISYLNEYYYDFSETDDLLNEKVDKATTLEGYGITDAYTKVAIDKLLNNKLNKMPFDDVPELNSPCYLTSGAVYTALLGKADKSTTLSGYGITDAYTKTEVDSKINDIPGGNIDGIEKTVNKVSDTTNVTDESVNYPSIEYLKNYYYDFSETDNLFGEKYDASNIEYGSGTLTIPDVLKDRVLSGSFDYQKIDNWVDIQIYIEFKSYSSITVGSSFSLQGLPFVCINPEKPRGVCLTTTNKQMGWTVAVDSARLTLIHLNSGSFTDSEKLSISIRYKI